MLSNNNKKLSVALVVTLLSTLAFAGSSSVIYPKIKNNGNSWFTPSTGLRSEYENYFVDMDSRYKSQLVRDPQFSESLLNVCGEVSALFYRYLHDEKQKNLFHTTLMDSNGLQRKEALPFTSKKSQYYERDMVVEYPMPSLRGKYRGQFVYQYTLKSGAKSIFQLKKNSGGGDGKNKQMLLLADMNYFAIDENGNKQITDTKSTPLSNYVMLKIDRLTTIKSYTSEAHAFQKGQQNCTWLNKRLN